MQKKSINKERKRFPYNPVYTRPASEFSAMVNGCMAEFIVSCIDVNTEDHDLQFKINEAFKALDTDGSGELDLMELINGLKEYGMNLTEENVAAMINFLDSDRNGSVRLES